jgi:hypothetical protein
MSAFHTRWQELARASRALPEEALPPAPRAHWPLRGTLRPVAISRRERRGLVLGGLAMTASWVLAVALWPAVTAPSGAATATPAPGAATAMDVSLTPVAHLSAALPALPHPTAPTALLAQAYGALTDSDPSQEPHL